VSVTEEKKNGALSRDIALIIGAYLEFGLAKELAEKIMKRLDRD